MGEKSVVLCWKFADEEGIVLREDNKNTRLLVFDGEVIALGWLLESMRMEKLISENMVREIQDAFAVFVKKYGEKLKVKAQKFRKWEAIRIFCKKHGYEQAFQLAHAIDTILLKMYDSYNHDEQFFARVPHDAIGCMMLVEDASKCPACDHVLGLYHRRDCTECLFGREYGICHKKNSIFKLFLKIFKKEAGI